MFVFKVAGECCNGSLRDDQSRGLVNSAILDGKRVNLIAKVPAQINLFETIFDTVGERKLQIQKIQKFCTTYNSKVGLSILASS